jgi:RHS repeat-associated protein
VAIGREATWAARTMGARCCRSGSWRRSLYLSAGVYNNRLGVTQGVVYDTSGNTTTDNMGQIYTWDAESRIASARTTSGTVTYKYDAEDNLVYKSGGASGTFMYYRDAAGRIAFSGTPSGNPGATGTTEAYVDGDLVGNWVNSSFSWVGHDWLGTKRYESTGTGSGSTAVPVFGHSDTSLPFGDATVSTPATDYDPLHFTGKERDAESGNDYFGARYYSSAMGRWLSPDWSAKYDPVPYAKLDNPQTLNLYQYVLNNPLSAADDDGHEIIYITSGTGALQNEQTVRDTVTALLANPNTSGYLGQFVGNAPGTPDLVIMNGDLSAGDSKTTAPDGTPGTSTVQGNTDPNVTTDGKSGGPIITIDNRTSKEDTPGVLTHETVHAGESQKNPAQFVKDSKAEAGLPHDKRPQEQRANAVQKKYGPAISKAVKQIEKERKKEEKQK